MKSKTKKTIAGWVIAVAFGILYGVICWTLQMVPTCVGPLVTVAGWLVMSIIKRIGN